MLNGQSAQVLHPANNVLLNEEVWGRWQHDLGRLVYHQQQAQVFVDSHAAWFQERQEARLRRQQSV